MAKPLENAVDSAANAVHVERAEDVLDALETLETVERRHVLRVLRAVADNKTLAARILGIGRKTLYRMLERWGVSASADPAGDGPAKGDGPSR